MVVACRRERKNGDVIRKFKYVHCSVQKVNKSLKTIGNTVIKLLAVKSMSFVQEIVSAIDGERRLESIHNCQGPHCSNLPFLQKREAVKVCHHTSCQEINGMSPMMLCGECDHEVHTAEKANTHLRIDLITRSLSRRGSLKSTNSDSGTEDDTDSICKFDKKNRSYGSARRFFSITSNKSIKTKMKKMPSFDDSSKDYFTIQFYDETDQISGSEKVAVKKGRSLKESIDALFTRRELDFERYSVFLESSNTPLPLMFDTFPLGGNTLHVKANKSMQVDARVKGMMNAGTDDKNTQKPKKILSIVNETIDNNISGLKSNSLPTINSKFTRKPGIYASSKDVSKNLSDVLLHYSQYGFDGDSDSENQPPSSVELSEDITLEESWTDVIHEDEFMSRQHKIQQEALWELFTTERNYLRKIKVIIEVFQKCLTSLQSENILCEIDNHRLFSNINDVYQSNYTFWKDFLQHIVDTARESKSPVKPRQLAQSFSKFEELFEPYVTYCLEESSCVKYLKYLKRSNEMFEEYLAWCENHRQCMRLKLADLLVKPMQRVTKYSLLLKAVLGKTLDDYDRTALESMILNVERFVTKINTSLRLRHERQKLDSILTKFELYTPVETGSEEIERILFEYSTLDLRGKIPGLPHDEQRCILLDGPMKLVEKQGRIDVHAFLFTDVFIIAKAKKSGEKYRIIRQPYRLNKVVIHPLKDQGSLLFVYMNEYNVLVTAFTLIVNAQELLKWKENIEKAKLRYERARSANGSTLDFFDDDCPSFLTTPTPMISGYSPAPDRRSMTISDPITRLNSTTESQPSIIVTDDLNFKSKQTISRVSSQKDVNSLEVAVKRSHSDPKTSWSRDNTDRSSCRPISLITSSDHDTATWVLKNEKRERSGSIPSDISNDSRRSSGIGDSFRSINSDSIKDNSAFGSFNEGSTVAKLKARFEFQRCQSPSTEDSSSSISTTSLPTATSNVVTESCRRTTPPEYDQPSTIHEEEEQSSNHSIDKISDHSTLRRGSEKASSENDSSSTTNSINTARCTAYENIDSIILPLQKSRDISCQTEEKQILFFEGVSDRFTSEGVSDRFTSDAACQCDFLDDPNETSETVVIESNLNLCACADACTQSREIDIADSSTQSNIVFEDVGTQCGDFIHLSGESETDTDLQKDLPQLERTSSLPSNSSSLASLPDISPLSETNTLPRHLIHNKTLTSKPRGILKHSQSEVNLPLMTYKDTIYHERSRSDGPRQNSLPPSPRSKDSSMNSEFDSPGMRALLSLSESLESSLQHRSSSVTGKNNGRSPSLRRLVLNSGSPATSRRTPSSPTPSANTDIRSSINRTQSEAEFTSEPKRYTWHFNSVDALDDLQQAKLDISETESSLGKSLEKSFSKSTNQINVDATPKKQKSFKKGFFRKFTTDSKLNEKSRLERPYSVPSNFEETFISPKSTDTSKQNKKQLEKERRKMKKLEKQREKEERKREKEMRRHRSGSLTSSQSGTLMKEGKWANASSVIQEVPS